MNVKPATLLECFELAKRLSAEAGFKIFTPSRKYFRAEHQFIAASDDTRAKGIFRIWIHKNALWIEFLPFYENSRHVTFLESALGKKLKRRKHRSAMRRFDPLHQMVTASEHEEFDHFLPDVRLP